MCFWGVTGHVANYPLKTINWNFAISYSLLFLHTNYSNHQQTLLT